MSLDREVRFTPTWTAEGTQPELGNGTLTGTWDPDGNGLEIMLEIGSATTCGTGPWTFSVPYFEVTAAAVLCHGLQFGVMETNGLSGQSVDKPGLWLQPALWWQFAHEHRLVRVTSVEPWVWSTGDRLSFRAPVDSVRPRGQWLMDLPATTPPSEAYGIEP